MPMINTQLAPCNRSLDDTGFIKQMKDESVSLIYREEECVL